MIDARRTHKPIPGRPIDWGHPLARGLDVYLPLHERHGRLANNLAARPTASLGGSAAWTSRMRGGVTVGGPASYLAVPITPLATATPFSLLYRGIVDGWSGNYAGIFNTTTGSLSIGREAFSDRLYASRSSGSDLLGSIAITQGRLFTTVLTCDAAGAARLYVDGAMSGSGTVVTSLTSGDLRLGYDPQYAEYAGGPCEVFALARRVWTLAEVRAWTANPYAVVRQERRLTAYVFPAGGGTVADGAGAATLSLASAGIGSALAAAAGSAALTTTTAAGGSALASAAATTTFAAAAAAAGAAIAGGDGAATITLAAAGTGSALSGGTASSAITFTAAAAGSALADGDAVGASTLAVTVAGVGASFASAAGAAGLTFMAAGAGSSVADGQGAGSSSFTLAAAAAGSALSAAAASSTLAFTAAGVGSSAGGGGTVYLLIGTAGGVLVIGVQT